VWQRAAGGGIAARCMRITDRPRERPLEEARLAAQRNANNCPCSQHGLLPGCNATRRPHGTDCKPVDDHRLVRFALIRRVRCVRFPTSPARRQERAGRLQDRVGVLGLAPIGRPTPSYYGMWRSLAARLVRDQEAGSSNLPIPTNSSTVPGRSVHGDRTRKARGLAVIQAVAGSIPVGHPMPEPGPGARERVDVGESDLAVHQALRLSRFESCRSHPEQREPRPVRHWPQLSNGNSSRFQREDPGSSPGCGSSAL
jgi:hypothetical protein